MAYSDVHSLNGGRVWELAARQHGVVTRAQLMELGFSAQAIVHRRERGRLHGIWPGVYAVGRPELTRHGRRMAATLACGPEAALSHWSAAELGGFAVGPGDAIEISVPAGLRPRAAGVVIHRRKALTAGDLTRRHGIPTTTPACTLIDLAARLRPQRLERAIDEADRLDLIDPESLRHALEATRPRPGTRALRAVLEREAFVLTDSDLERRFIPVASGAGLPRPLTRQLVSGFKVDFYWPELGLVVETDGLRYHRTPAQQARDRLRDQALAVAGLTCLRFTHRQVAREPGQVGATLRAVARRLSELARR